MKKTKSIVLTISAAFLAAIIAGCIPFWKSDSKVSVQARILQTKNDCVLAFGKAGKGLLRRKKRKIYPIELKVENKGRTYWKFENTPTDLKTVDPKTVAKRMYRRPLIQAIFYGITATIQYAGIALASRLLVYGVAGGAATGATSLAVIAPIVAIPCLIGTLIFYVKSRIAPVVGYMKTKQENKKIEKKLSKISSLHETTILPLETRTAFLFVQEKDLKQNFSVFLVDSNGNKKTISCHCPLN